jgi:hypothetical protein
MKLNLRVRLQNIYARIKYRFVEPKCCGLFKNPDGRLVECDEWWGYQNCMYPGCGHYQLEHSDGTPEKIIYDKNNPENVGKEVAMRPGCMNAGCGDCPGFWDKAKLHEFIQQLSFARNHATHALSLDKFPGVLHTDARVVTKVEIDIDMRYPCTPEEYANVMDRMRGLQAEFPHVALDFHLHYHPEEAPVS